MYLKSVKQFAKCIIFSILITVNLADDEYATLKAAKVYFTKGSSIGLLLALALPLEEPYKNSFVAYNIEANFNLPDNATAVEYPPLLEREAKFLNRKFVYNLIETKMKSNGVPGKSCLLRIICEASSHTMDHNGVLADLLHVLLTPSSSNEEGISKEYFEAEKLGASQNCENILLLTCTLRRTKSDGEKGSIRNPIRFPYGDAFMGLFIALALPLEVDNIDLFFSYNFEGNYVLPQNQTEWEYPPIISKSFNIARKFVYNAFEFKLKSNGFPGKPCLLRSICEAAEYSMDHNGVLADLIHIMLSPSTSKTEGLHEYENAENYGRFYKHCKKYKKKCPISVLEMVSHIGDVIQ
ncbi:PREDICTED: uncharacterized protein LOC108562263 [Nicrophorus vespilloides]|uniref:Uncharacterized protein LOC108562263 n=1 Tax=Nicrophorus vespilloides TaxID=110193 RepID=A0ABM1MN78_NICVS|nr:PREDICTED: uncharacterized protein LOC108562263 [Nicrophorus vespilloides]